MSEIINFTKQRKAKARAEDEKRAAQNRAKFGRTKEEKLREKLQAEKLHRHVEGHKRETEDE